MQSCWHRDVVEECRIAFVEGDRGAADLARARSTCSRCRAAFEIPLHAPILAKTRRYTAIVAAGLVVDGGIYRHEFVADTVIKALMDVQLTRPAPSHLARLMQDAGLNPFAKTTTPEFSVLVDTYSTLNGITRNPWDLSRSPGGSLAAEVRRPSRHVVPAAHVDP